MTTRAIGSHFISIPQNTKEESPSREQWRVKEKGTRGASPIFFKSFRRTKLLPFQLRQWHADLQVVSGWDVCGSASLLVAGVDADVVKQIAVLLSGGGSFLDG